MAKNRHPYKIREWLEELTNTYCTSSSHDALSHLTKSPYHLIVIEVGTLKERTHQLIQIIRKITKIPILVIMRGDKEKSISYVESGADMAVKEASSREDILSYVYALTRRYLSWSENNKKTDDILQIGPLMLDKESRKMFWDSNEIYLSKHEFDLLYLLALAPNRVYTFEQIYETVWCEHPHGDIKNILWCAVRRLRKKMRKKDPRAGDIIKSVRNVGYYLDPIKEENT